MQKYKLTDKTIEVYGRTLHQIVCVRKTKRPNKQLAGVSWR